MVTLLSTIGERSSCGCEEHRAHQRRDGPCQSLLSRHVLTRLARLVRARWRRQLSQDVIPTRRSTMAKTKKQADREDRIHMEIVVDAYGEEERAMGWYYYLEGTLQFPFSAQCTARRQISPLRVGDRVEVVGMANEDHSLKEIFVNIRWDDDTLAVPLAQLEPIDADDDTVEAVEDWHYWVGMGYGF